MADQDIASGGFSRRTLLKGSVVAGGLAWAAPVLFAGPASAQTGCTSCPGLLINVKMAGQGGADNCGNACLDTRGTVIVNGQAKCAGDCPDSQTFVRKQDDTVVNGQVRESIVHLAPDFTVVSASFKSSSNCFYADCNTTPPFKTTDISGADVTPTRIVLEPEQAGDPFFPGGTRIIFDTNGIPDSKGPPLNFVDILICYNLPGTPLGC